MTERIKPTFKQQEFAREYVNSKGNGTQAALKAYDTGDPMVASVIAYENLKKPYIKEAIEFFKRETKELADEGLQEAIAHARNALARGGEKQQAEARKFLLEAAKLFTSPNNAPRESKHLHLTAPERK